MSKKYVIEFTFYEDDENTNSLFLFTDNSNLKRMYIPEKCYRITLYKREDYELLNILEKQGNDFLNEIEVNIMNAESEEDTNILIGELCKFVSTTGKEISNSINNIQPLKDIYIGEILMKKDIAKYVSADSNNYKNFIESKADGIIFFKERNSLKFLDYYFKDSNVTMGGLSYSGHLELDEENNELF